jgi:hypothetical protein
MGGEDVMFVYLEVWEGEEIGSDGGEVGVERD